ncbi:phosphatase PAP2 family protein [Streptomyces corynorhini]|uniref:Phosphatase PAP2 family protein n=1 Tax=Streptomyces corynorhini TaxID=2282652 RepID=A0A370BIB0_9ACTN|nr:phosphatase PAP2 family protein [Streptomyces corynorhini]RDG39125.1 phosphatase PAP2 family protein [Streptomyces corynorhini]
MTATGAPALLGDDHWFDDGLYSAVTELAHRSPGPLDTMVSLWSAYGLALFGALLLAGWWRARPPASATRDAGGPARAMLALTAPAVVLVAFAVSSVAKSLLRERRPCQTLHVVTVEACPALGDWSLPSNHAVIAAAAATVLLCTDRRLAALAVPAALLMAASRVWVGVHYPHDVALGLVVGVLVSWPLMVAARRAAPLAGRLRETRLRPLVARR